MVDPDELNLQYTQFATMVYNKYGKAFFTNYDSAEPVLGRGITLACIKAWLSHQCPLCFEEKRK